MARLPEYWSASIAGMRICSPVQIAGRVDVMDTLTRYPDRARTDREDLDRVLDAATTCTFATVLDGQPWLVPMFYARDATGFCCTAQPGPARCATSRPGRPLL